MSWRQRIACWLGIHQPTVMDFICAAGSVEYQCRCIHCDRLFYLKRETKPNPEAE